MERLGRRFGNNQQEIPLKMSPRVIPPSRKALEEENIRSRYAVMAVQQRKPLAPLIMLYFAVARDRIFTETARPPSQWVSTVTELGWVKIFKK